MLSTHAPALIVVVPMLMAIAISIVGHFKRSAAYPLTVTAMAASLWAAWETLNQVLAQGALSYRLAGWAPPQGIEYAIDPLNAVIALTVTVVATLVAIYSRIPVEKEIGAKIHHFYTLFTLLVVGLLGITLTGDAFNLYVLIEISALSTYALLAFGGGRAYFSTFNYLIMGTIGACLYLLGVGYLYIKTGSLNIADLATILPALQGSTAVFIAFTLLMVGLWIKMAFFPLHGWLPNAYSHAPIAVTCLVAPLMTKVTVYVMIRVMYTLFSADYTLSIFQGAINIVWLSVIAIVAGSFLALNQKSLKKMLAYIIVAEVGYMVGGAWLGNQAGYIGATYHIISDAIMTLTVFLAAGAIIYRVGDDQLSSLKGILRKMPLTSAAFLVGAVSMIGVPPTSGFFSKWMLIQGGIQAGHWGFVIALLFSSLVNAILFFRIIEIGFFEGKQVKQKEAPISMLIPTLSAAVLVLVVGVYSSTIITEILALTIPIGLG